MSEVFAEDYMEKIILLENLIGSKTSYQMLDPFSLNARTIIEIQTAAKKIAKFIGLSGLTFLVTIAKQKEKVGGHIELKYGDREVFIEISDDTAKFDDAILATLAHEISHKYLQINGISCGTDSVHQYANEVLTDITSVFLGLGKLMLNGCECQNVRQEYSPEGTKTITETLKSGYLDRSQLAFVYRLVCAMRRIPFNEYGQGLSTDSIQALRNCEMHYRYYFDKRFHESNIRNELVGQLRSAVRETQSILSSIDKNLLYLQASCADVFEAFLKKMHNKLMEVLLESEKIMMDNNEYDPALRFFNALELDGKITKLVSELNTHASEARLYKNTITEVTDFIQTVGNPLLQACLDMFNIVVCRNCGTKLRLPQGKNDLIAKCPNCQYNFVADTMVLLHKESCSIQKDSVIKKLLRRLFGRKQRL